MERQGDFAEDGLVDNRFLLVGLPPRPRAENFWREWFTITGLLGAIFRERRVHFLMTWVRMVMFVLLVFINVMVFFSERPRLAALFLFLWFLRSWLSTSLFQLITDWFCFVFNCFFYLFNPPSPKEVYEWFGWEIPERIVVQHVYVEPEPSLAQFLFSDYQDFWVIGLLLYSVVMTVIVLFCIFCRRAKTVIVQYESSGASHKSVGGQEDCIESDLVSEASVDEVADNFKPEKMVPGSEFSVSPPPPFQAQILVQIDGEWVKNGNGVKLADCFLTSGHVIRGFDKIRVKSLFKEEDLDVDRFEEVGCFDLMRVKAKALANMPSAKLNTVAPGASGDFVYINDGHQQSIGLVSENPNVFGSVIYSGSTKAGFSGSAYFVNKMISGIHVGASSVNMGACAAYVAFLLKRLDSSVVKPEDSEDFLKKLFKKGVKHTAHRSMYDPDEVDIKINGKYYRMNADEYYAMQDNDVPDEIPDDRDYGDSEDQWVHRGKSRRDREFRDFSGTGYESVNVVSFDDGLPSGNLKGPVSAGLVSVSTSQTTGKSKTPSKIAKNPVSPTSPEMEKPGPSGVQRGMENRELTAAPKSEASQFTSTNTSRSKLRKRLEKNQKFLERITRETKERIRLYQSQLSTCPRLEQ